jgi:hypothetical protein
VIDALSLYGTPFLRRYPERKVVVTTFSEPPWLIDRQRRTAALPAPAAAGSDGARAVADLRAHGPRPRFAAVVCHSARASAPASSARRPSRRSELEEPRLRARVEIDAQRLVVLPGDVQATGLAHEAADAEGRH